MCVSIFLYCYLFKIETNNNFLVYRLSLLVDYMLLLAALYVMFLHDLKIIVMSE